MAIESRELKKYLDQFLNCREFSDYGPNGHQIEGKTEIKKIAFAVSATRKSVASAVERKADALIVHHGLFWNFHGPKTITGPFAQRVIPLIQNSINLYGYHLPLDAHPMVGNAASLAYLLKLESLTPFGDYKGSPTGVKGSWNTAQSIDEVAKNLEKILNHNVLISRSWENKPIQKIGIITGGANSEWAQAARLGLDAYITGEMSEHDWNEASESNITMFAGGHHATEQFGIQNLMAHLKDQFQVECFYIDSENPA